MVCSEWLLVERLGGDKKMDLAEERNMLTTSPTSRYALAKSFSLRLLPRRLYAIGTNPTGSEILLSRLFKLSVQSLRGYAEAKESTTACDITNFVDVVASQRYAQCRELAVLLRYIDSAPDTTWRALTTMRLDWKKALARLRQEDVRGFLLQAGKAERRLEHACRATAERVKFEPVREQLLELAASVAGVCERMEELLGESAH